MTLIVSMLIISAILIKIDGSRLIQAKMKKEFRAFILLLLFSFIIVLAKKFWSNFPNPADWVALILKPFAELLVNILN
jgi:glucan phosphoethanolaminetransferase (alkaline phosphatase superfamily)